MNDIKIDFESVYEDLASGVSAKQKKLTVSSPLGVYYGISEEGYYRLSFMSKYRCPHLEGTKTLRVLQGNEGDAIFWTCFDLLNMDAKKVFYAFCQNMVESVCQHPDENSALKELKKRYATWRNLFKKDFTTAFPAEIIQGLYGELFYLKNYMAESYGIDHAVRAWGGPDFLSKDFSIGTDWFEVKTVGANAHSVTISSLAQLSSEYSGRLVVIRVEAMSDEFSNGESSVGELLSHIQTAITSSETTSILVDKLNSFCNSHNIELTDLAMSKKFNVKDLKHYIVSDGFPRITEKTAPFPEITAVEYKLSLAALDRFKEV